MLSNFKIQLGVLCGFFVGGWCRHLDTLDTCRCQAEEENNTHSRYTWCTAHWLSGRSAVGRCSLTEGSDRPALRAWEDRRVLRVGGKAYASVMQCIILWGDYFKVPWCYNECGLLVRHIDFGVRQSWLQTRICDSLLLSLWGQLLSLHTTVRWIE